MSPSYTCSGVLIKYYFVGFLRFQSVQGDYKISNRISARSGTEQRPVLYGRTSAVGGQRSAFDVERQIRWTAQCLLVERREHGEQ